MASNYTTNYKLPLWEGGDSVLREEFNEAHEKVDAAIAAGAKIVTGSYVGTGTYGADNPNTLTFGFTPKVVFIYQSPGYLGFSYWTGNTPYFSTHNQIFYCGANRFSAAGVEGTATINYTLENNMLTWYTTKSASLQMNNIGASYGYIAIG